MTTITSTPTQIDDGTALSLEVVNAGPTAVVVYSGQQFMNLRPGTANRIRPDGPAFAATVTGSSTITVTATAPGGAGAPGVGTVNLAALASDAVAAFAPAAAVAALSSALAVPVSVQSKPLPTAGEVLTSGFTDVVPSTGRTLSSALITMDQSHASTLVVQHADDNGSGQPGAWATLDTITPVLSGGKYVATRTLVLTKRYLQFVTTNGAAAQTSAKTTAVLA